MSPAPSGLDDPRHRAHAVRRFYRILRAIAALGLACALAVVAFLWWWNEGPLPYVFIALIIAGVWLTILMAGLLMGLMFLSSGTGHDERVEDRVSKDVLESYGED